MKIETERLILREIKKGDEEPLMKNINNLNVSKYLLVVPFPYTIEDANWYVNHCLEKQKDEGNEEYSFFITIKPSDEPVGGIGISELKKDQGTAHLGYWIAEEYWRKGYVSEAVKKLIEFCFEELNLRKVIIPAFLENEGSNGLAKKLGFKYEGTLRSQCVAKSTGRIHDENIYGLLREEWETQK